MTNIRGILGVTPQGKAIPGDWILCLLEDCERYGQKEYMLVESGQPPRNWAFCSPQHRDWFLAAQVKELRDKMETVGPKVSPLGLLLPG